MPHNEKLKDLRLQRLKMMPTVWTQSEVARRIGVSMMTYARWEQGGSLPHKRHLKALCKEFSVTVDQLGFESGEPSQE